MNQKARKKVTLEIEFNSFNELKFVLNKVLGMAQQHHTRIAGRVLGDIPLQQKIQAVFWQEPIA